MKIFWLSFPSFDFLLCLFFIYFKFLGSNPTELHEKCLKDGHLEVLVYSASHRSFGLCEQNKAHALLEAQKAGQHES